MPQGMCDPSVPLIDYLTNFEFIKAFTCAYANPAGFLVVGLIVWAGISAAIYTRHGSIAIPGILLMLTAGAILSTMAAPGLTIAGIVVLLLGPGVVAYAVYRYSR